MLIFFFFCWLQSVTAVDALAMQQLSMQQQQQRPLMSVTGFAVATRGAYTRKAGEECYSRHREQTQTHTPDTHTLSGRSAVFCFTVTKHPADNVFTVHTVRATYFSDLTCEFTYTHERLQQHGHTCSHSRLCMHAFSHIFTFTD